MKSGLFVTTIHFDSIFLLFHLIIILSIGGKSWGASWHRKEAVHKGAQSWKEFLLHDCYRQTWSTVLNTKFENSHVPCFSVLICWQPVMCSQYPLSRLQEEIRPDWIDDFEDGVVWQYIFSTRDGNQGSLPFAKILSTVLHCLLKPCSRQDHLCLGSSAEWAGNLSWEREEETATKEAALAYSACSSSKIYWKHDWLMI